MLPSHTGGFPARLPPCIARNKRLALVCISKALALRRIHPLSKHPSGTWPESLGGNPLCESLLVARGAGPSAFPVRRPPASPSSVTLQRHGPARLEAMATSLRPQLRTTRRDPSFTVVPNTSPLHFAPGPLFALLCHSWATRAWLRALDACEGGEGIDRAAGRVLTERQERTKACCSLQPVQPSNRRGATEAPPLPERKLPCVCVASMGSPAFLRLRP